MTGFNKTRFNKIAIHDKRPSWQVDKDVLIESPMIFHLCVTHLSEIFVSFVLNIFTVLPFTQSVDNLIYFIKLHNIVDHHYFQ